MILYANGCSITVGDEISDDDKICHRFSYSGLVANHFNYTLINQAQRGGSNNRIIRTSMDFLSNYINAESKEKIFVLIGWTSPERMEFYDINKDEWINYMINNYHIKNKEFLGFFDLYSEWFVSAKESINRYLNQVILFQSFLKLNKIPYLFLETINSGRNIDKWLTNFLEKFGINKKREHIYDYFNQYENFIKMIDFKRFMDFGQNNITNFLLTMDKNLMSNTFHPTINGHYLFQKSNTIYRRK